MMTKTSTFLFFVGIFLLLFTPSPAHAEAVQLQAMMIQAQNEPAPMDRRLERVEYKLRRVFGFNYYSYVGEGSLMLNAGSEATMSLPRGHSLRIRLGGKGKAEVRWFRDGEALLSTSVGLSRNSPVVLGGVPSDGGTLILVLDQR